MHPRQASAQRQQGISYLWVLLAVAFVGAGAGAVGEVWHTAVRRDKEAELLFIGDQFRRAIGRYYDSSAGTRSYPATLDELLADERLPMVRHHLRRLYADPFTGKAEWGLVRGEGKGIVGVYSLAPGTPLKTGGFAAGEEDFENATSYGQWIFVHRPQQRAGETAATPAGSASATNTTVAASAATDSSAGTAGSNAAAAAHPQDEAASRERVCNILQRNDAATCASARRYYGDASGAQCEANAAQRQAACRSGDLLPGLSYSTVREGQP